MSGPALLSSILDPIFSSDTSEQDRAARAQLEKARNEYNIPLPNTTINSPESLRDLGGYQAAQISPYDLGDPTLAQNFQEGQSSYNDIATDPRLRTNQQDSIAALDNLAKNGGFNAQDQANLSRNHMQAVQDDKARRDAILQHSGATGMSGSGNDLLAQLQSSQAATNRESQYGLDVAGQGQDRALQAIMQSGQLSGQMQNQDFSQQAQQAAARDAISRFNTSNLNSNSLSNAGIANQHAVNQANGRLSTAQSNQGAQNQANQYNATNSQNISNQNVTNANTAQSLRDQLPQQNFNNLQSLASGRANADAGLSNSYTNEANRIAQKDANYMGAAIQGGAAIAGAPSSPKKKDQ